MAPGFSRRYFDISILSRTAVRFSSPARLFCASARMYLRCDISEHAARHEQWNGDKIRKPEARRTSGDE